MNNPLMQQAASVAEHNFLKNLHFTAFFVMFETCMWLKLQQIECSFGNSNVVLALLELGDPLFVDISRCSRQLRNNNTYPLYLVN